VERLRQGRDVGDALDQEAQDPEVQNGEAAQVARWAQEHGSGEVVEVRARDV
jgi:hypothetical protein